MKFFIVMGIAVGILVASIAFIIPFFADNPLELRERVVLGIFPLIVLLLIFIVLGSLHIISRGFFRIAEQEAFFGIRFDDEMKNVQISTFEHISHNWFISTRTTGVLVFKRGFIVSVDKVEEYYQGRSPMLSRIMATTANGKKIKVISNHKVIEQLLIWQNGDLPEYV